MKFPKMLTVVVLGSMPWYLILLQFSGHSLVEYILLL